MPGGYCSCRIAPADLYIPENLIYDYMIYRLSKIFSISPHETGNMKEYDFWIYTGFENIDNKRKEYYMEENRNLSNKGL